MQTLKERGWIRYTSIEEGDLTSEHTASVPEDVDASRINFGDVDDLTALPRNLSGPYDCVLAANSLCRLSDPEKFLRQLGGLARPGGGIVVLSSPYDWRESCTPREKWLGGFKDKDGTEVQTKGKIKQIMEDIGFTFVFEEDLPYIVRESRRNYLLNISHATVWSRK